MFEIAPAEATKSFYAGEGISLALSITIVKTFRPVGRGERRQDTGRHIETKPAR
jgi:hypothetical protein